MFEPQKFVYHYTGAETFVDKVLPSMTLRLGSFQSLNDPREAKTWPFKFYSRHQTGNQLFAPDLFEQATKNVTQRTLILCCSRDEPTVSGDDDNIDIRSGYGHPRMWAQYADGHRGVCLVLDHELLHERIVSHFDADNLFSGPVEYLNTVNGPRRPSPQGSYDLVYLEDYVEHGVSETMESHIRLFHREMFFTKHLDWRDEWEFRWVVRSENDTPQFVSIDSCLNAVILGHDCTDHMADRIVELCRVEGIPVHRAHWQGWSLTILPNLLDKEFYETSTIIFDGVSYNTKIPCGGVFVQARDQYGNARPIRIDNNGDLVLVD